MCVKCGSPISAPGCGCGNGKLSTQKLQNPDCNCVGIQNIAESQDGKKLIITLTNGVSTSFDLPEGPPGPKGDNGTNGTNGINGSALLFSDATDSPTTAPGVGSYQILKTGSTDSTQPGKNLVNVGDAIRIFAVFTANKNDIPVSSHQKLMFNDNIIGIQPYAFSNGTTSGPQRTEYEVLVTLTDDTPGNQSVRIITKATQYAVYGMGYYRVLSEISTTQNFNGQNFNSQNNLFTAQANSSVAGDTICQELIGEILKK